MKTNCLKMILALLVAATLAVSCMKEKEQKMSTKPSTENFAMSILEGIAQNSNQTEFKSAVHKLVQARFDGDDNVLCKEVISQKRSAFGEPQMEALLFFQNQGLYPQIYIPFVEEVENRKTDEPIVFVNAIGADDSVTSLQGYYYEDDVLKETSFLIDEEYAMNHEVWVISINERVDENGNPIMESFGDGIDFIDDGAKASRSGIKFEYVKKIKCPDLSEIESWFYGAPELRCICTSPTQGILCDQLFYPNSRSSINNKFWLVDNGNPRRMYQWNISVVSELINFKWIELDNSGTTVKLPIKFKYHGVEVGFEVNIKKEDKDCGSYSPMYNDGLVGDEYKTGLITWIDKYDN